MKYPLRNWLAALLCMVSFGCAAPAEKPDHNDPTKYTLAPDILWASPDGFDLTMDIYTPTSGKDSYPVLIIFHGGGWLINDKSIMDQAAKYFATNSEYVICNVNYRLLGDQDNTVTIDQIVEDTFGAVLWAQDNIRHIPRRPCARGCNRRQRRSAPCCHGCQPRAAAELSRGTHAQTLGFSPSYLAREATTAESVATERRHRSPGGTVKLRRL